MNQVFCVLPIQKNSTSFFDVNNFHIILPPTKVYNYYTVSVNGLITFTTSTEIIIWNPTMKEHIIFVKPKSSKCLQSFLGYDPMENKYKLLSLACSYKRGEKYQKPKILTLGSQESSWRVINSSPDHDPSRKADISLEEDRDYHSILPPLSKEILELRLKEIIMSFDVRSEQFKSIQIPGRKFQYESMLEESLMCYQGKVAWICYNSNIIKLWVLKDAEKQVWSENEFVLPLPQRDLPRNAWLRGATSTGEFIYVSGNTPKNISAFYYDPVRETIRSVKGIENEKFRRCYGSNDNFIPSSFLHAFPNHIENLMSLKGIMCSPFM
ncbi:unnamed protein product [Arabidopsis lyrata]|uniref:F-box associated beta-propeller type 3 domain-containing protein n=1 Tax=Arabidopsis lyrata subsp. lyrata TaxID=81972 RepID=D7MXZ0_ARALL|nr:hypothetical protein ARALYDRAFT_333380 [Arabidopsis lyrata subsp. lyrata]CAH8275276.1 unnamed protein product [Arabidopsis lyrata]